MEIWDKDRSESRFGRHDTHTSFESKLEILVNHCGLEDGTSKHGKRNRSALNDGLRSLSKVVRRDERNEKTKELRLDVLCNVVSSLEESGSDVGASVGPEQGQPK